MRSTRTLIASEKPKTWDLIAQIGIGARETQTASAFAPAAEITRHALETQAAVHGLLNP